jgi:hypothetical protein
MEISHGHGTTAYLSIMARSLRYVNTATEFLLGTKDRYE